MCASRPYYEIIKISYHSIFYKLLQYHLSYHVRIWKKQKAITISGIAQESLRESETEPTFGITSSKSECDSIYGSKSSATHTVHEVHTFSMRFAVLKYFNRPASNYEIICLSYILLFRLGNSVVGKANPFTSSLTQTPPHLLEK